MISEQTYVLPSRAMLALLSPGKDNFPSFSALSSPVELYHYQTKLKPGLKLAMWSGFISAKAVTVQSRARASAQLYAAFFFKGHGIPAE